MHRWHVTMNLLRRSGAPPALTWLLGLALSAPCASMIACSAASGSQNGSLGWQSGGGPLGGGSSNGTTPGSGQDATSPPSTDDGDAAAPPETDGGGDTGETGAGEAAMGDGAATDASGDGAAAGPDFTLLDTNITGIIDGSPVAKYDPIPEGATINLAVVGSALSVRANTVPATVGSVGFALDATYTHTENTAPYCLCSDDGKGDITSCANILTVGTHKLTATPYSGANLTGDAGAPFEVDFTIVDVDGGATDAGGQ